MKKGTPRAFGVMASNDVSDRPVENLAVRFPAGTTAISLATETGLSVAHCQIVIDENGVEPETRGQRRERLGIKPC